MCLIGAAAGGAGVLSLEEQGFIEIHASVDKQITVEAEVASVTFETAPKSALLKPSMHTDEPLGNQGETYADDNQPMLVTGPQIAQRPTNRLGYVPFRELALLYPKAIESPTPEALLSEDEGANGWSASTSADPEELPLPQPGPRSEAKVAAKADSAPTAKSENLPWQNAVRPKKIWNKRLTERLAEISPAATLRLARKFESANASWPPAEMALVAIKDEKALELHARTAGGAWKFVHRYPVLAASGGSGPKLRQGDKQVPEGIYGISFLNPDSKYHVSMRVNYPNTFDRAMAKRDGRSKLGGDIMIHGKNVSAGCLAVGDEAAEELFVLAAETGLNNVKLVIAPTDFRQNGVPDAVASAPNWVPGLYTQVASAMQSFRRPQQSPSLLSFFGN